MIFHNSERISSEREPEMQVPGSGNQAFLLAICWIFDFQLIIVERYEHGCTHGSYQLLRTERT